MGQIQSIFFSSNNNLHTKTEILIFNHYIISFINLEIFLFTEIYLPDELQHTIVTSLIYKSISSKMKKRGGLS